MNEIFYTLFFCTTALRPGVLFYMDKHVSIRTGLISNAWQTHMATGHWLGLLRAMVWWAHGRTCEMSSERWAGVTLGFTQRVLRSHGRALSRDVMCSMAVFKGRLWCHLECFSAGETGCPVRCPGDSRGWPGPCWVWLQEHWGSRAEAARQRDRFWFFFLLFFLPPAKIPPK